MRKTVCAVVALLVVSSAAWASNPKATTVERKTIKQVMKEGHGGGPNSLFAKVTGGSATMEEKVKLLDLYVDLRENEPSKGEPAAWQAAADKTLLAVAKAVAGREGALDELKEAGNCKACHDVFKGK